MLKLYVNQELNHIKPLLGSEDSLMVGDRIALPQNISKKSGQLYTWGRGSEGQLGHGDQKSRGGARVIKGLKGVTCVGVAAGLHHSCVIAKSSLKFSKESI